MTIATMRALTGVLQFEHQSKRGVDAAQFLHAEVPDMFTEASWIDRSCLLSEDPRR